MNSSFSRPWTNFGGVVEKRSMCTRDGRDRGDRHCAAQGVSVTAGQHGLVWDGQCPLTAYRRLTPSELAAVVLDTMTKEFV
ncbi:hypothetical protein [Kibdelosporangium philippinense]|uniref:hypothetical protein n=1 Tax=Kibdelosporangium philippinense TaxID=211113 RepID=UPI003617D249